MLILLLILAVAPVSAAEPFADWKYHGRIQAPDAQFVALPLLPQNLNLSEKSDLSDVRIIDARGVEVPYAVVFETEVVNEATLKGREFNREYPDPSTSRVTVDFGAPVTKNKITVQTEGNNFRRSLRVEGSDDLRAWATILQQGWLIAAGDTPEKRFESFDIGSNNYRYLRVSVTKMPEEQKPPEVRQVSFRYTVIRKPQETTIPGTLLQSRIKGGTSIVELDFGLRNLSMQRFRLLLGRDPARIFEKECKLSGRNSLQHEERIRFESGEYGKSRKVETSWEHLGSGTVFQNTQGELSLDLKIPSRFRYLRIEIENGDGPPLDISGVTAFMTPAYLVFEPAGQSRFDVYTGNPAAPEPRYESAKMLRVLDIQTLTKCPLTTLEERTGVKPKAKPEAQRFVWIVLAVVVLFTAWVFWNTAKTIGKYEAGPR